MLPSDPFNLIISGVGGQGNVLASRIIAGVANKYGYQVTVGDTFGVSQRGGAVMSHVRISCKNIYGPLIPSQTANIVLGLEPLETVRVLQVFGNQATVVLSNNRPVYPLGVQRGTSAYPREELYQRLEELSSGCRMVPAAKLAEEIGSPKTINVIMVGALAASGYLPFGSEEFQGVIKETLPEDKVEMNLMAYEAGVRFLNSPLFKQENLLS